MGHPARALPATDGPDRALSCRVPRLDDQSRARDDDRQRTQRSATTRATWSCWTSSPRARARAERADRAPHRRAARDRGQSRRDDPRGRPRAARRRAGSGEDAARADGGAGARPRVLARAVHARPDAERHHGHGAARGRPRDGAAVLQVRARSGVRERRAGRRDQPRAAEDAGGAAAGDAGARRDGGGEDAQAPRAVHRAGDAEPDRAGGNVSPARGAARPVHGAADGRDIRAARRRSGSSPRRRRTTRWRSRRC